jgi:hypothetical protein
VAFSASRSVDGGMTWGNEVTITTASGVGPTAIRCCLPAATIDHSTGELYAVWEGSGPHNTDPVQLSSSTDRLSWTAPVTVSQGDGAGVQEVNVAVAADEGNVFVSYGTRTDPNDHGGFVQQKLSYSSDGGVTFAAPLILGPPSALQWAARANGYFPGDYVGASVSNGWLYLVWCVSSQPPTPAKYHQVLWAAALRYE